MGYILPIQNYQSQYYHERVTQPERDPIPIDRLYPKRIASSYHVPTNQERLLAQDDDGYINQNDAYNRYRMAIPEPVKDVYADLTGIGGRINMYV
ncbi:hypothetical protein ACS127_10155 [Amphibacillus sp. Q70]|uniref:hypothetical protein n=1 Tax=Amphibacillus sp. Q70 TaxID=3453416 RepID=UPI003F872C70